MIHTHLPLAALLLGASVAAQSLGPPTLLPGDDAIDVAAGYQQRSTWAAGDDQFLVVWEDARGVLGDFQERPPTTDSNTHFKTDLVGARYDVAGNPIDEVPFVISGIPWIQRYAQVAWNGENYLVVWQSEVSSALTYSDGIFAARVSPEGVVLDVPPILIEDSIDVDEIKPAVASDGSGWVVTWHDFNPGSGKLSVRGALIAPDGAIVGKKVLGADTSGFLAPFNARIAWAQDRYMVAWEHFGPSGEQRNLFGRMFDAGLAPLGPEFEIAGGPGDQSRPAITSDGSQFFVAWNPLRASPVLLDGTVVVPGGVEFAAGTPAYGWTSSVAWDGAAYLLAWEGATTQGYSIHAARVDTSGGLVPGYPVTLDTGLPWARYTVTGGANGLGLVSWTDVRLGDWNDVWSKTLDANGAPGALSPVSVGAPTQTHVDIAGNSTDGYLVAFVRRVSGSEAIHVQRVDGSGTPLDAQPTVLVTDVPNRLTHTAVAHGPEGWLVVWENIGFQFVRGMRVGLDGTVLDAAPQEIVQGNDPDVAYLDGEFLVVSSYMPQNDVRIPRIRRMRASDGALLGGEQSWGSNFAVNPAVVALEDRWMVAYERHLTHDSPYASVRGYFVEASGLPQPEMTLASGTLTTLREPALAAEGTTALVSWSDGDDLRAGRVLADGTLLDGTSGFLLGDAANEQRLPAAAWDGTRWTVAYTDYRVHATHDPGVGDAYVTTVAADGSGADLDGTALANHPFRAEGRPALAADAGTTVAAYVAHQDAAPHGTLRVELRTVRDGVGEPFCFGDGGGTPCPCGNDGDTGEGCVNSAGSGGRLSASGSASVAQDDLLFLAEQLPPNRAGLLFVGTTQAQGGLGVPVGDGLLCIGGTLSRLGVEVSDSGGTATWGPGLGAAGTWAAGDTRYFQTWYRDPSGPCASTFNFSNAVTVTFEP